MNPSARRPLHNDLPTTPTEQEDQVDNRTFVTEGGYEEGTSSPDERESGDDETPKTPPRSPAGPSARSIRQNVPFVAPNYTPESAQPLPRHGQPPSRNWLLYGSAIVALIAIVAVGCCFAFSQSPEPRLKTCAFKSLRKEQPQQPDKVWATLQNGIEGLINKKYKHPSVFLFLHQDKKLQKLIQAIASEASKCYGGPSQLIHMSKDDFGPGFDNYGLAIERFKERLKDDGKVFLIVNLNEIAPKGARALHTICDTYSPLVEDAVIFLTLRTSNTTAERSTVDLATDTLYDLWSNELKDYELDPLITRVIDQVLHLSS